jgi:hypothetical protein
MSLSEILTRGQTAKDLDFIKDLIKCLELTPRQRVRLKAFVLGMTQGRSGIE